MKICVCLAISFAVFTAMPRAADEPLRLVKSIELPVSKGESVTWRSIAKVGVSVH